MKKFGLMLTVAFTTGIFATAAYAAGNPGAAKLNPAGVAQVPQGSGGSVPQAQIDLVKKRDEMNKRREQLLKIRQQLIQADDPGNVDGQHPVMK